MFLVYFEKGKWGREEGLRSITTVTSIY